MKEAIPSRQEKPVDFDEILNILARNMRQYDILKEQINLLNLKKECELSRLELVDLDVPIDQQPEDLAYSALGSYVIDKNIEKLSNSINNLQIDTFKISHELGSITSKILITSKDPQNYEIGTLMSNGYGDYNGMSWFHDSKKGRIEGVGMHLSDNGWVHLKGKFGLVYQAAPLIDRKKDYAPCFDIELVG